ncbi:hypothetical protein ACFYKX_26590 [Cytobacillus sp. FJAT-54145]|uniref:Uncharacterized protein n=1 Tax=Cytobacillus spartinae TaxID=3299023 RepID=A0ABW6KIR4_9BACI
MYAFLKFLFWFAVVGSVLYAISSQLFWYVAIIVILAPILYWWDSGNWVFSKKKIKEKNDNVGRKFTDIM